MAEFTLLGGRYQKEKDLGKGSFGKVFRAIDRIAGNNVVAIKQMDQIGSIAKFAYREIFILRRLKHPSVVSLFDVFTPRYGRDELLQLHAALSNPATTVSPPDKLYLSFELMDTDLKSYLKNPGTLLSEEQQQYMMFQFLCGLHYIHSKNVIHRDLKSANLLVNFTDCSVKIADFGLSRVANLSVGNFVDLLSGATTTDSLQMDGGDEDEEQTAFPALSMPQTAGAPAAANRPLQPITVQRGYTQHVITRWYRAPEVILLQQYSTPVDVWSAGCIFAEMLGCDPGNKSAYGRRQALFPGHPCGDLSADHDDEEENEYRQNLMRGLAQNNSQLSMIFNTLGSPSDEDIAALDPNTANILRQAPYRPAIGLERILPASSNTNAMDLLKRMLTFNPQRRISIADALNHPFFDSLKQKAYFAGYLAKAQEAYSQGLGSSPIEAIDDSTANLFKNIVEELLQYR